MAEKAQPQPIPYNETADDGDGDSALGAGGSIVSSTASLTESIMNYRKIHGRTFGNSKTTEYWGPNDEQQNAGLDITHHWVMMLQEDKLFNAPIDLNSQNILDVGTGTGIWAIDVADKYPLAQVIGTDISPIQPSWVPPNCKFEIEDCQLEWTFPENHFGFIYMRTLFGSIADWPALYKQAFKATKPGGWFENFEFDNTVRSDSPIVAKDPDHVFHRWTSLLFEAAGKTGRGLEIAQGGRMKKYMEEAGFVDIIEKKWSVPVGGWSSDPKLKLIGQYNYVFCDQSLEGFAMYLLIQVMGWQYSEVQALAAEMRAAMKDNQRLRPYYDVICVMGRKPESKGKEAEA